MRREPDMLGVSKKGLAWNERIRNEQDYKECLKAFLSQDPIRVFKTNNDRQCPNACLVREVGGLRGGVYRYAPSCDFPAARFAKAIDALPQKIINAKEALEVLERVFPEESTSV